MRAILGRLFSRSPGRGPDPLSRLTPEQAADIAVRAAAGAGFPGTTGLAVPGRTEASLVWDVCQTAYGSGWRVSVDDATGAAGPVGRWGIR